jgi:hypothetical protein
MVAEIVESCSQSNDLLGASLPKRSSEEEQFRYVAAQIAAFMVPTKNQITKKTDVPVSAAPNIKTQIGSDRTDAGH